MDLRIDVSKLYLVVSLAAQDRDALRLRIRGEPNGAQGADGGDNRIHADTQFPG